MTIVHTGRQSVIVRNTSEGAPGRYEATAVVADPVLLTACSLQAVMTERQVGNLTDVAIGRYELFAPAVTPLTSTSHVELVSSSVTSTSYTIGGATYYTTGVVYEVDGEPALWHDHAGRPHHTECYLKARTS
jgi:hypothetical protein